MSFSSSLANALTGLTSAARAAELTSSNVANALTEGYGKRQLELSAQNVGGRGAGVQVEGVRRVVDQVLLSDRRLSDAALQNNAREQAYFGRVEAVFGVPGEANALTTLITQFENSLIEAASRPDTPARLETVVRSAQALVQHIGAISDNIQQERLRADTAIEDAVTRINGALQQVATLNTDITKALSAGQDASGLMDQRQRAVDTIATFIPIKTLPRQNGQIAIVSTGGAVLLDRTPVELGFTRTNTIVPEMTQTGGALSGLTIGGQLVDTAKDQGPIRGGALAALFDIRDHHAPAMQAETDALARDLVTRFQDPTLDPTLTVLDAGLFTDAGGPFDPLDETGLSGRLQVNGAVDPEQGGALWKLRDGLNAAAPGDVGDAALLQGMLDALSDQRVVASGHITGAERSFSGFASDVTSLAASDRLASETEGAFLQARHDSLRQAELADGVDTDEEMQKLLLIEQAYSANARVIQTVDELIQILMRI